MEKDQLKSLFAVIERRDTPPTIGYIAIHYLDGRDVLYVNDALEHREIDTLLEQHLEKDNNGRDPIVRTLTALQILIKNGLRHYARRGEIQHSADSTFGSISRIVIHRLSGNKRTISLPQLLQFPHEDLSSVS